jgi:hypothetical protein
MNQCIHIIHLSFSQRYYQLGLVMHLFKNCSLQFILISFDRFYWSSSLSHVIKNSMLISGHRNYGPTYLVKFTIQGSTLIPSSVVILNGTIDYPFNMDPNYVYFRFVASSSSGTSRINVLQVKKNTPNSKM